MTTTPSPDGEQAQAPVVGRRAGLTARFLVAVGQEVGAGALTPTTLARAVARVLPVDAAGMSTLSGPLRVPLGASSADAALAELLQTSLGEGPCLDAALTQASVALDLDELRARWPVYTVELTRQTPFRAVAAIPLRVPSHDAFAALDLFSTEPKIHDRLDLAELDTQIGAPSAALLTTCLDQVPEDDGSTPDPEWYRSAARRRHDVWVAIGMVMAAHPEPTEDALSLMRAHAYSQDRSLDDLAADLVHRRLPATDIT